MITNQTNLQFTEGTSDKVYIAAIHLNGEVYSVICHYGRRGSTQKTVDKGTFYSFHDAYNEYDRVIRQKTSKGYWITEHFDAGSDPSEKPSTAEKAVEETVAVLESWTSTEEERLKALTRLKASCAVW